VADMMYLLVRSIAIVNQQIKEISNMSIHRITLSEHFLPLIGLISLHALLFFGETARQKHQTKK